MDDLGAIRHGVREGRIGDDDYWRSVVLSLCDEVERWRGQASRWADNIAGLTRRHDRLLATAQAWADAIERQDVREIEAAEKELIIAIAACSLI